MRIELEFDVGEGLPVYIDREVGVFGISFPEEDIIFDWQMPSEDALKQLTNEVKEVMNELHIKQPSYFILKLENYVQPFSNNVSSNDVFLLRLPVQQISKDKITVHYRGRDKHELYHELMHIKDVLSPRFPTIGCGIREMKIINLLWGFSIEGRLERMGKPHQEREEAIRLLENSKTASREQAEGLCDKLWGKEVTYEELKSTAKKLM